jgi:hypothetical protein
MTINDLQRVYPIFDLVDRGPSEGFTFMRYQVITKRAEETILHAVADTPEKLADQLAALRLKRISK